MIIIDKEKKFFHLRTKKMSYVFRILKNGSLGHLYYGEPLAENENFDYLINDDNKAAGTIKYYQNDSKFSLGAQTSEFNINGTSDFRQPAIELRISNQLCYGEFAYVEHEITCGKERTPEFPCVYGDEYETLTVTLYDENLKLYLKLNYSITEESSAVVRSSSLVNNSQETYTISKFMSGTLDIPDADLDFISLSGAWLRERHLIKRPLRMGSQLIESTRGASSHQHNPFVMLADKDANEFAGTVYAASLVYSGSFLAQTEVDEWNVSRTLIGINPMNFAWQLEPNTEFKTPECIFAVTKEGFNGISRTFHNLINNNVVAKRWKNSKRPIVVNSWEASYFKFNEDSLLKLADLTKKIGADTLVVDDGWFGERDSTQKSLGDWFEDKRKFPHGMEWFAEQIHNKGLKLGLWFEPEMVSPISELYKEHPDWCIHIPGRNRSEARRQLILDYSREDVCNYIIEKISEVLSSAPISYVKWDMNRNMSEIGSAKLPANRQREVAHRYILGLYKVLEEITTRFPDVLFESCSGGGGRFDPGMLYYMPQTWTSDNTDAIERLKIQFGTSMVYPNASIGCHVSAVPNHQVDRITPIETRGVVAMSGNFGYELDITKLPESEKEIIKEQVKLYKEIRETIQFGKCYRLSSPFENNDIAWMFISKDCEEIIVSFVRTLAKPNSKFISLKLVGLDESSKYEILGENIIVGGDELMNIGLNVPELKGDYQAKMWRLKKVK